MGGFTDWVSNIVESSSMAEYRARVSDAERYVTRRASPACAETVHNGLRTRSIAAFLRGLPVAFQREARGTPGHHVSLHLHLRRAGEANVLWALLRGKLRVRGGSPKLLRAFARCVPA